MCILRFTKNIIEKVVSHWLTLLLNPNYSCGVESFPGPARPSLPASHGERYGGRTETVAVWHLRKVEQTKGGHARPRGVPAPGRRLPIHLSLLQPCHEHEPEATSARVPAPDPGEELCDGRPSTRAHICLVFLRAILMPFFSCSFTPYIEIHQTYIIGKQKEVIVSPFY